MVKYILQKSKGEYIMNFSQRLGLFILILISVAYVYFSFFNNDFNLPKPNENKKEEQIYNPLDQDKALSENNIPQKENKKTVKIYLLDNSGKLQAVKRDCDPSIEKSCFEYAIKQLVSAPSRWEKSHGFTSEIPIGTNVLSVRESSNSIMIDLSSNFESGGGAESTYLRIKQIIKTANANTSLPTYLYINGKQANVIGGEGIMIKQPLNERSFDE